MHQIKTIDGHLNAADLKFAILATRFNDFIVDRLVGGAVDYLIRHGGSEENLTIVRVPGAFEMPLACKKLAASGKYDGIVAVGARFPLVAFNINLSTSDVEIANKIAKTIRESSGGMRWVKSIGVMLEERNTAQVSINMTNYTKTPIYRVYETVRFEAARYGVQIIGSELIGIVPMDALVETAEYYLKLENFDKDNQVMEKHLL